MKLKNIPSSARSKIIIANWKMNLSIKKSLEFVKKIKKTKNQVVIAAPFTFLSSLAGKIDLAAQNVSQFESGAYTGEVSAKMLKQVGCSYSLVGHSERRIYFGETDQQINQKIKQLLANNIKVVLCVGEKAEERNKGLTKKIIKKQLESDLKGIKDPGKVLIAYEPIWAISTFQKGKNKKSANITDILEVHNYIRKVLLKIYGIKAGKMKILYGGSVKPDNSKDILSLKEVDGALVGGASLKISSFNAILEFV